MTSRGASPGTPQIRRSGQSLVRAPRQPYSGRKAPDLRLGDRTAIWLSCRPAAIRAGPIQRQLRDKALAIVQASTDRYADAKPATLVWEETDGRWPVAEHGDAGTRAEGIDGCRELWAQKGIRQRRRLALHGMPHSNFPWAKLTWTCYRDLHLSSPPRSSVIGPHAMLAAVSVPPLKYRSLCTVSCGPKTGRRNWSYLACGGASLGGARRSRGGGMRVSEAPVVDVRGPLTRTMRPAAEPAHLAERRAMGRTHGSTAVAGQGHRLAPARCGPQLARRRAGSRSGQLSGDPALAEPLIRVRGIIV